MKGLILDTETTGLHHPQVIEIAYLPVDENLTPNLDAMYQNLFKPNKEIEPEAVKVHGISVEQLEGKPTSDCLKQYAPEVFEDNYIIGHHIDYDINAINNSVGEHDFKIICTKRLAFKVFPNLKSYSLVNLTKALLDDEFNELTKNAHRADTDVLMAFGLLTAIARRLEQETGEIQTLDTLYALSEAIGAMSYEDYARRAGS